MTGLSFTRPKDLTMTHDDPHSRAADAVHAGRPVEEQLVKQGRGGRRMSIVMGVGIALTLVGFVVLFLIFSPGFSAEDANTGQQGVDAAAFQEEPSTSPAADGSAERALPPGQ